MSQFVCETWAKNPIRLRIFCYWVLVEQMSCNHSEPLEWSGSGRSRLLRLWCSVSVLTTGSEGCVSTLRGLKRQQSSYLWSPKPFFASTCGTETRKVVFIAILMQSRWKIVVQSNLQRDYWNRVDNAGTPLSNYSRMAMPNAHPSSNRENLGVWQK